MVSSKIFNEFDSLIELMQKIIDQEIDEKHSVAELKEKIDYFENDYQFFQECLKISKKEGKIEPEKLALLKKKFDVAKILINELKANLKVLQGS